MDGPLGRPPLLVTPDRMTGKRGKNDAADAAAICEAIQLPHMRFVPAKNMEQRSRLKVHRARQGFVEQRNATLNRICGLLSEFGIVLPLKAATVRRRACECTEYRPGYANTVTGDLLSEVTRLEERVAQFAVHILAMVRDDERAATDTTWRRRPQDRHPPAGDAWQRHGFDCGRQFATYPSRHLVGIDAEVAGQACHRDAGLQAQPNELGPGLLVVHTASTGFVTHHRPPFQGFQIYRHTSPLHLLSGDEACQLSRGASRTQVKDRLRSTIGTRPN
jgi:hypothetical protein